MIKIFCGIRKNGGVETFVTEKGRPLERKVSKPIDSL